MANEKSTTPIFAHIIGKAFSELLLNKDTNLPKTSETLCMLMAVLPPDLKKEVMQDYRDCIDKIIEKITQQFPKDKDLFKQGFGANKPK